MNYKLFKFHFNGICQLISLLIIFAETFVVLLHTWILAYMDPAKGIILYIDKYGEAIPELIMWIVLIPYCTYGTYLNLKMMLEHFRTSRRRLYKYL
jgi:hypothetical protein